MTIARPRPLTQDERKAAEAAFLGTPFDPEWSNSARVVYEGIVLVKMERNARRAAEQLEDAKVEETEALVR